MFIIGIILIYFGIRGLKNQKEIKRINYKQETQQRDLAKVQKEQLRQAEILRRHEEQISKLRFQIAQAQHDIETERNRINKLYALLDLAQAKQAETIPGSKTDEQAQRKILSLEAQISTAEKRIRSAEFKKQTAEQKLRAA